MAVEISGKIISTDEYDQMVEAGVLTEDERVELIEGVADRST